MPSISTTPTIEATMTIKRENLKKVDFSDIATGENIEPVHPGEILREDFLVPNNMTAHALAMALHVPAPRINDIVRCRRAISPETALRLARYFGTTPEFWASLQAAYDLRVALAASGEAIAREVVPLAA
ncbi:MULTISPECIES: HigA family addiction module antitoxin [Cupriavidus]|uniref:HigA family addiction module antitoxin n=1 Tax=Cupriavidus TaxID=106589 RepID=UPI0003A13F14|nr:MULTISPECIES: HigA family addiction module antitoxin [Cupriavidus]